jgi:hypothetical protein
MGDSHDNGKFRMIFAKDVAKIKVVGQFSQKIFFLRKQNLGKFRQNFAFIQK